MARRAELNSRIALSGFPAESVDRRVCMKTLAKIATIAAALGMISQPCVAAAAVDSPSAPATATMTPAGASAVFDLQRLQAARIASASLSLAASQQTAAEAEEPSERRGSGTTWLVVGGVVLLAVVVLAVVASGTPTAGPPDGAFD